MLRPSSLFRFWMNLTILLGSPLLCIVHASQLTTSFIFDREFQMPVFTWKRFWLQRKYISQNHTTICILLLQKQSYFWYFNEIILTCHFECLLSIHIHVTMTFFGCLFCVEHLRSFPLIWSHHQLMVKPCKIQALHDSSSFWANGHNFLVILLNPFLAELRKSYHNKYPLIKSS